MAVNPKPKHLLPLEHLLRRRFIVENKPSSPEIIGECVGPLSLWKRPVTKALACFLCPGHFFNCFIVGLFREGYLVAFFLHHSLQRKIMFHLLIDPPIKTEHLICKKKLVLFPFLSSTYSGEILH